MVHLIDNLIFYNFKLKIILKKDIIFRFKGTFNRQTVY